MTDKSKILQIGFLVRDLDKSVEYWNEFLDTEPETIGETDGPEKSHAEYNGEICYGRIRQAVYQLSNISIELIQPIGEEKSFWKDCLIKDGPGIHHIAFRSEAIKNVDENKESCHAQYGEWDDGKGKYAYYDMRDTLNTVIELLEF